VCVCLRVEMRNVCVWGGGDCTLPAEDLRDQLHPVTHPVKVRRCLLGVIGGVRVRGECTRAPEGYSIIAVESRDQLHPLTHPVKVRGCFGVCVCVKG
jgi:hypothetical protein